MKVFSFIKKLFPPLIGLLILWSALLIYSFVLNKHDEKANAYIPKDANFVFKMSFKDFLKSSTYSLIFNSQDQELLNSFEAFLNKQRQGKGKSNDYGIDFLSDFTLFGQKFKQGQNYVMIFKLVNPKKFTKNLPHYLNQNQAIAVQGDLGVLVTHYSESKISKSSLTAYAQGVFEHKREYNFAYGEREMFHVNLKDYLVNKDLTISKGEISSTITETEFDIDGELDLAVKNYSNRRWSLIPALSDNPLHIENSIFSRAMQDSIQNYMEMMGISSPAINHISLNYYGVKVQFTSETDLGIIITPIFDLIVTFDKPYSVDSIFKNSDKIEKFGFKRVNNAIYAGEVKYKIREIDSTTLYIGNNNELVIKRNHNDLFKISGDISRLTKFEGGGFMLNSIISSYPPYKASKDLFEGIRRVNLVITPQNNKILIKGRFNFRKDHYLFNDLLKFYLNMKGEY